MLFFNLLQVVIYHFSHDIGLKNAFALKNPKPKSPKFILFEFFTSHLTAFPGNIMKVKEVCTAFSEINKSQQNKVEQF